MNPEAPRQPAVFDDPQHLPQDSQLMFVHIFGFVYLHVWTLRIQQSFWGSWSNIKVFGYMFESREIPKAPAALWKAS